MDFVIHACEIHALQLIINWATLSGPTTFSITNCVTVFHYNLPQLINCSTHSYSQLAGNIFNLIFTNYVKGHQFSGSSISHRSQLHPVTSDHYIFDFFNFIILSHIFNCMKPKYVQAIAMSLSQSWTHNCSDACKSSLDPCQGPDN